MVFIYWFWHLGFSYLALEFAFSFLLIFPVFDYWSFSDAEF
jgi:hypothetical protein